MQMPDQIRNLNPTPEAVAAMWLHSKSYAAQNGGSMDFWDKLSGWQQKQCADLVADILAAHAKHSETVR